MKTFLENLRTAIAESPGISIALWFHVFLIAASLIALPLDHRTILGINPWIKPLKFQTSAVIFLLTMALMLWALGRDAAGRRTRLWLGWGFSVAMIVEDALIVLQSARGVPSHMNYTTPLNTDLFAAMGIFILLNSLLALWLLLLWLRPNNAWPASVVWGVRFGLLMLVVASLEGVRIVRQGAHTVGAADGGPGLPFINWSTLHGDLRAAHFIALHGLQIFPLMGIALVRLKWPKAVQLVTLSLFVLLYTAGVRWLFAEAMHGVPILYLH
jgi:hypothetical protein